MDLQPTASPLEEELGLRFYATEARGIGGRLRSRPEDFVVEEITKEGLVANQELGGLFRGEGKYSLAVLTKTSRDTIPTSRQIGETLNASVSFAGIKDRRAITSQLISIDRRLEQGGLELKIPRVAVRVVGLSKWPLEPGELRGNRFTITVRGLQKGLPETFKADWLPGYFGHQRFGTTRPNTHRIGRFLVKKDFEGAVRELVAEPYPNEPEAIAHARSDLKASWNLSRALKNFPRSLAYERMVLMRLMESPGDPLRALKALPWSMVRLYVNAYQSYLFNLALSRRWEQYGLGSLENGDYASPLDRWGSPARPIKTSPSNVATLRKMVASGKGVLMMRVVGARTEMEGNDRDVYFEILETEGITLHDFENIAGSPFFGTLRFSLFRPIDFSLSGASPDELFPGMQRQTVATSLPKGCYATVLLREMMRPADPFTAGF
jgi:tRNA pseudouridine13 synthase